MTVICVVWTHGHPEIKFQSTAYEDRKDLKEKNKFHSTRDVFKSSKKAGGWTWTTFDGTVWHCTCWPLQPRRDGSVLEWEVKRQVTRPDTAQMDSVMYLFGEASAMSGTKQNMEVLSGPRCLPLSAETKHLLKHWIFAFSMICSFWCCCCLKLKREGLHMQWRHSVRFLCQLVLTTKLDSFCYNFKLFLMIFKCIYVSFFTLIFSSLEKQHVYCCQ